MLEITDAWSNQIAAWSRSQQNRADSSLSRVADWRAIEENHKPGLERILGTPDEKPIFLESLQE